MADQQPNGAASSGDEPQAPLASEPRIQFNTQYIKDLSFENPRAPLIYTELPEGPEIEVQIDVGANPLREQLYEVALALRAEAKVKDKIAFIVELEYAGLVTLASGLDAAETEALLMIETPRHFFPFARAIVSNVTRDGGFPPLLINPIDFAELHHRKRQMASQAAPEAESANA